MLVKFVYFIINSIGLNFFTSKLLRVFSVDIPRKVKVGKAVRLEHGGLGVVIHPNVTIGNNVRIYQGVTLGRKNIWDDSSSSSCSLIIEDDVILCSGAKVLFQNGMTVARGTILGANSVLTKNTNENEIWAGIPAKKVGMRNGN